MATVAYPNIHTPYQQPPSDLLPAHLSSSGGLNCDQLTGQRIIGNQMTTAMDTEIGRLLVETGLATRGPDGALNYDPATTNTMVIVIGDNGTLANSVKEPFDPTRAKATVYQTGVWVPLIIAGPLVNRPNRDDLHMVNAADLFELFGEIAGLDVHKIVPASHQLDSVSMLPYLENPAQPSLRKYNFTQTGDNLRAADRPGTCVIGNQCNTIVTSKSVCDDNNGTWYEGVTSCCDLPNASRLTFTPDLQTAIRNDEFKLVQTKVLNCNTGSDDTTLEFFAIDEAVPKPKLDYSFANLLRTVGDPLGGLNAHQLANYDELNTAMQEIMASEVPCPGDGNLDKVVDELDIDNWQHFAQQGTSSWYDFNLDGLTNQLDLDIINANFGRRCQ